MTVEKAKLLLWESAERYSDEELQSMIDFFTELSKVMIEEALN